MAWRRGDETAEARRLARALGRFARAEDGVLMIFGLFVLLIMMTAAGFAVDTIRHERERARTQATLDRAVLAAADLQQRLTPEEVVADHFAKAGLSDRLRPDSVVVEERFNHRSVSAATAYDVPTMLLHMVGVDTLGVATTGRAEEQVRDVEISLVLDVSGSMADHGRIVNMRRAASDFIRTVMPEKASASDEAITTVSLVPYSSTVNLGPDLLARYNVTDEHDLSNCVMFRDADFTATALPPTRALEQYPHFDVYDGYTRGAYYGGSPHRIRYPLCPGAGKDDDEVSRMLPVVSDPDILTGVPDILAGAIPSLRPYYETGIDAGMRWGIAMLDPQTRPVIDALVAAGQLDGAAAGRPLDYDEDGALKVAILMTDGDPNGQRDLKPAFKSGMSNVWWDETTDRYSVLLRGSVLAEFPYREVDPSAGLEECGYRLTDPEWDALTPAEIDGVERVAASAQDDRCAPRWYWVEYDRPRLGGIWTRSNSVGKFRDHPYTGLRDDREQNPQRNRWDLFDPGFRRLSNRELFDRFTTWDAYEHLYRHPREKTVTSGPRWVSDAEWSLLGGAHWHQGRSITNQWTTNSDSEAVTRLLNLCAAAEAKGITIYTIGFELDQIDSAADRERALDIMHGCATSVEDHYFDAMGVQISEVFSTIATRIDQLRLTQ